MMNRNIGMKYIISSIMKKKFIYLILVTVCVLGLAYKAYAGYEGSEPDYGYRTLEWYQETLQGYEDAVLEYKNSLAITEGQLAQIQDYCNNSEFMKIDPQNVAVTSRQYIIVADNTGNKPADVTKVAVAYQNYMANGAYISQIDSESLGIEATYVNELVTVTANSNTLVIKVVSTSEELSMEIADQIDKALADTMPSYISSMGNFSLQMINDTTYIEADMNLLLSQNTYLDKRKAYEVAYADQKKGLNDREKQIVEFKRDNDPANRDDIVYPQSLKKTVIKHAILGVVLGIILMLAYEILRYIMSDTIKSKENLIAGGVRVLGEVDEEGKASPSIERLTLDAKILIENQGYKSICLITDSIDDKKQRKNIDNIVEAFKKQEIECQEIELMTDLADPLEKLMESKCCITLVQLGYTTYASCDELRSNVEKYKVAMLGSIVVG